MSASEFSIPSAVVVAALAVYFASVGPFLGRRTYQRLVRRRPYDPGALIAYYRRFVVSSWLVACCVPVVLWWSPGLRAADLGLAPPRGGAGAAAVTLLGPLMLIVAIAGRRVRRRMRAGEVYPARQAIAAVVPATSAERWWAVAVSVTAGMVEELFFRGLLIAAGTAVLGLPVLVAALLSVVIFAFGHLYQGRQGVVATGYLGTVFTALYLLSGSLLVPMAAHIFIDIHALLFVPVSTPEQVAAAAERDVREDPPAWGAGPPEPPSWAAGPSAWVSGPTGTPADPGHGGLRPPSPGGD